MNIRYAKDNDIKAVHRLLCELKEYEMDFTKFTDVYNRNMNDANVKYIVAEDNGIVIGFISVHFQYLLHHLGREAEVQELIVSSDVRSKGAGKALLDFAKSISKDAGCVLIEVATNRRRERTHGFYEKNDMKRTHFMFTHEFNK